MSHRDVLAKLSNNYVCVVNPNPPISWNFTTKPKLTPRPRPNLIPRPSSKAEIEFATLARPAFRLPPLSPKAIGSSQLKSFVLSSPSASFNRLLVDETLFNESPVVI